VAEIKSICVFCGASTGNDPHYRKQAERLGTLIADAGIRLVFGGGKAGLMGAVADGALSSGGEVIGVIPDYLKEREHGHPNLSRLEIVDSMHSRKQSMFDLADGFVTLPGGVGTLDETFEIVTWKQLRMHDKPIVVVDLDGYWKHFDDMVGAAVDHGFASARTRTLYAIVPTVDEVLTALTEMPSQPIETDSARF
jgi:uncharacterized protein (TIGR00730 family)